MTDKPADRTSLLMPDAEFQKHLDEGRFMIQRDRTTGQAFYYPRVAAPRTGSTDLEWFAASGKGVVYSTTVVRTKPPVEPYNVALIDLEEGPRVTGRVVGVPPADVRIGMLVTAQLDTTGDRALLIFAAAKEDQS